jgi:transposase-like protein
MKETMIKLWGEGMPKDQRDIVSKKMKRMLFMLVNSVRKHLGDEDKGAIKKSIQYALKGLKDLSGELKRDGYDRASEFIRKNARLMVTFARLAVENIKIPYTSNLIERLMGQVAKRCKHIWAHWSTDGLENILQIILVKYCSPKFYERFYKAYIAGMYN